MTFTGKFLYMAHHFILLRSIPLNLCWKGGMVVWALCHGCGFDYQQKRLKTFPGAGYLCSDDGVVWLWHYYIYIYLYLPTYLPTSLLACLPTYLSIKSNYTYKQTTSMQQNTTKRIKNTTKGLQHLHWTLCTI